MPSGCTVALFAPKHLCAVDEEQNTNPWIKRLKQTNDNNDNNNNNGICGAKMQMKTVVISTEFYKRLPTVAPQANYISHVINFKCSACIPNSGAFRAHGALTVGVAAALSPGAVEVRRADCGRSAALPSFLSGIICSVRARSLSRPGAAIDWLRHRRRKSFRVPMGSGAPRPPPPHHSLL